MLNSVSKYFFGKPEQTEMRDSVRSNAYGTRRASSTSQRPGTSPSFHDQSNKLLDEIGTLKQVLREFSEDLDLTPQGKNLINEHYEAQIEYRQQKLTKAEEKISELEKLNRAVVKTKEDIERDFSDLKAQNRELRAQGQTLADEKQRLRNIIVDQNTDKNEPNEVELSKSFNLLSADVANLLKLFDLKSNSGEALRYDQALTSFHDLCAWSVSASYGSTNARKLRLRYVIFRILKDYIFNVPCFGLKDDMEKGLCRLEIAFRGLDGQQREIAQWRKQTLSFLELLDSNPSMPRLSRAINCINHLLGSFAPKNSETSHKIDSAIVSLCQDAYSLLFRLRKSRSDFKVIEIEQERQVTEIEDKNLTVLGSEDGSLEDKDIIGSKVDYTIFGALVKHDFEHGKTVVLEKAQVVCYREKV